MVKQYIRMKSLAANVLHSDDRGVTSVEYGIMVALIAIVIIGAVTAIGLNLSGLFDHVANTVNKP